jgi:hypothetical protein
MTLYRSLLAFLASLSADPQEIDREPPRAAAAVAAAYSTFAPETSPAPPPIQACGCEGKCTNGTYKPDGRIPAECSQGCLCGCKKAASAARECDCSAESGQE